MIDIVGDGFYLTQHCCVFTLAESTSDKSEKLLNQGPQFTSGVIMKVTDSKPLPGRKFIKVKPNFVLHIEELHIFISDLQNLRLTLFVRLDEIQIALDVFPCCMCR